MFQIALLFTSVIIQSLTANSADICASGSCVCRDDNKGTDDYLGEHVDCAYYEEENLLTAYTLSPLVYSLDLSSSNISELQPSKILESNTLVKLFVNYNRLTEIKAGILKLPELKWLELGYNQLKFIDKEAFSDIDKLEYLNLANNRFTTYDQLPLHHLSRLNELVLDNNDLGPSLEGTNLFDRNAYGVTHKIKSLSISGINLRVVPDNFFSDAYDIRKLTISNNKLREMFELPFTLQYLDISDNPIEVISAEDFNEMIALSVLKLNNLGIIEVPEYVFESLGSLTQLELERNRNLTAFSSLAFGNDVLEDADDFVLETLSLKGSRLTKLDDALAEPFGKLTLLDLQGNPLQCDCGIVWLKTMQIEPEYYEHLRCGSPKTLFNAKIFELDSIYFKCQKSWSKSVGVAIAGVSFCLLLTAIALWFFVFVPRYQSRGHCISNIEYSAAGYTVIPIHRTDI